MNNGPLVSCVIIFYNVDNYLADAIESVLHQTYRDWELLLVDDGSADDSTRIALGYAQKWPEKVRYLAHPNRRNRGKNASRNLGIAQSQGKYIALLDGDDVWLPQKLAEQVSILEQTPQAAMVYGRTLRWSSWAGGDVDEPDSYADLGVEPDRLIQPPTLAVALIEGATQTPTTCNAIVRKAVFQHLGGFDEDYHEVFEDLAFFAKVESVYPVFVAGQTWAKYRKHPESSFVRYRARSENDRVMRYETRLKFLNWLADDLVARNIDHAALWACLRTQRHGLEWRHRLLTAPVLGPVARVCLPIYESTPAMLAVVGRYSVPAPIRVWLWKHIGKRLF